MKRLIQESSNGVLTDELNDESDDATEASVIPTQSNGSAASALPQA
jgi:hypothetical protein